MSEVKVNKISPRTACGTVTLGDSGDTFTIPSGATITNSGTASGFGATGAVSWDTSSIKTAGFTATVGIGYFCNTTSGIFTVALPAGSAGDVVGIADYAQTFNTNNLTVAPNGSEKIGGIVGSSVMTVDGVAATLVYVDGTQGWTVTDSGSSTDVPGPQFITATGGTPCSGITVGDYKTHIFTGPGSFCVSCAGNPGGSSTVDYLIVAGAGAGGSGASSGAAGGGGAGGFRMSNSLSLPAPTTSPLASPTGVTVTATGFPISIGGGGAIAPSGGSPGGNGTPTTALGLTSTGGGGAGDADNADRPGTPGGSGGGASTGSCAPPGASGTVGAGNTPPVSPAPPQGNPGGLATATNWGGGGGGGAGAAGACSVYPGTAGAGGVGSYIDDTFLGPTAPSYGAPGPTGSTRYFAGGGGGGSQSGCDGGAGGAGGGTRGVNGPEGAINGCAGAINTGGGSGGTSNTPSTSGGGGSGIVIIRYKFQ